MPELLLKTSSKKIPCTIKIQNENVEESEYSGDMQQVYSRDRT